MEAAVKCVLRSLDKAYNDVTVWSSDLVTIGRSRDTKIKDKRCSKQQLRLECDCMTHECRIQQLGNNSSSVNGVALQQNGTTTARHGDVIEVLTGGYQYRIEFVPPPNSSPKSRKNSTPKPKTTGIPIPHKVDSKQKERNEINTNLKDKHSITEVKASSSIGNGTAPSQRIEQEKISSYLIKGKDRMESEAGNGKASDSNGNKTGVKRAAAKPVAATAENKKQKLGTGGWQSLHNGDLLVFNKDSLPASSKIASYDMDGTLITTQSGRVFATDYNDWKILFSEVPNKLQQLHQDGYKIVIFTNQAGIGSGKQTVSGIQGKITKIIARCGVPVQVFVSTGQTKYRKPAPYMWQYLQQQCNDGVSIDLSTSVYVGDAAGRPQVPKGRKKDHSSADRLFALNLALPFQTPEEHFLGRKQEAFEMPVFDPRQLVSDTPQYDPADAVVPSSTSEVVVLCGYPGSGKSLFTTSVLTKLGYHHANRDTLGSWQKCVAAVQKHLKAGESVVVDNTNPDKVSRGRYTKLGAPARCFVMNVTKEHARHNNKFRELTDPKHEKVSEMIFNMYKSKFQEPSLSEGFKDIVKVNFVPKFRSSDDEKLYRMFLLEK